MSFGERIKKLRLEKGLTQEKLGKLIEISDRVIGYYETDDRFPKDEDILKRIADVFNVSTDYLLGRTDKPEKDIFEKPMTLAASMKNNVDLSEISEHDKDIIRNLIEQMKKNK